MDHNKIFYLPANQLNNLNSQLRVPCDFWVILTVGNVELFVCGDDKSKKGSNVDCFDELSCVPRKSISLLG
jgi:hypothetical protein